MKKISILGHCLCEAVNYELNAPPIWAAHCHCGSCRRHTASSVATFIAFSSEAFQVTKGRLRVYESSAGVRRCFCGDCGTPMAYESDRRPGEIHLYMGTLDEPEIHPVNFHLCYKERLPWLEISDDTKKYPEFP